MDERKPLELMINIVSSHDNRASGTIYVFIQFCMNISYIVFIVN